MNLISKLFNNPKVECPRCLGKGLVDWDDIKRLNKELMWKPGKCAYCNSKGKISLSIQNEIMIDNPYLTTDISQEERKRLLNGDGGALKRANIYENQINDLIKEIKYLHFVGNLNDIKIADFYLLSKSNSMVSEVEKKEFLEYVRRVIESRNESNNQ